MAVGIRESLNGVEEEFNYWPLVYFALTISLSIFLFSDGLSYMLLDWEREEFSHGYMIPIVSLFLLLQKFPKLAAVKCKHQFVGVAAIIVGILFYLLGELSAIYIIIQYGFIVTLAGIAISLLGLSGASIIAVPLIYLLFMIPLPNFLYFNLSSYLQLISSSIGVFILRLMNVSVYLEGNVIDLGTYRLQVVDACSGLRYLFPLMSFGFLVAYVYRSAFWKKAVIFLSTIPITLLMNSFRITVIGISVELWGIGAAEGFLHDFQGWVVFMACLGILALEILLIHRLSGVKGSPLDSIAVNLPNPIFSSQYFSQAKKMTTPAIAALLLLLLSVPLKFIIVERSETIPARSEFKMMPLNLNSWAGREGRFEQDIVDALKLKDYIVADYANTNLNSRVNLYAAYYESQRKGASVHSPKTCLPGGGWEIKEFTQVNLDKVEGYPGKKLQVNRVVIRKGETSSLVYYWFQQRGRIITNEYMAKWYIFWDALTRNRTDGSLVRLTVEFSGATGVDEAEKSLNNFIENLVPLLPQYIPE